MKSYICSKTILQEFRYGKETVQTTTNNYKDCRVETTLKNVSRLFGYGNMVWQESAGRGFKSLRDHKTRLDSINGNARGS